MSDLVVSKSLWGRLYNGQTSFDRYGKRRRGFAFSLALIVISLVSKSNRMHITKNGVFEHLYRFRCSFDDLAKIR